MLLSIICLRQVQLYFVYLFLETLNFFYIHLIFLFQMGIVDFFIADSQAANCIFQQEIGWEN